MLFGPHEVVAYLSKRSRSGAMSLRARMAHRCSGDGKSVASRDDSALGRRSAARPPNSWRSGFLRRRYSRIVHCTLAVNCYLLFEVCPEAESESSPRLLADPSIAVSSSADAARRCRRYRSVEQRPASSHRRRARRRGRSSPRLGASGGTGRRSGGPRRGPAGGRAAAARRRPVDTRSGVTTSSSSFASAMAGTSQPVSASASRAAPSWPSPPSMSSRSGSGRSSRPRRHASPASGRGRACSRSRRCARGVAAGGSPRSRRSPRRSTRRPDDDRPWAWLTSKPSIRLGWSIPVHRPDDRSRRRSHRAGGHSSREVDQRRLPTGPGHAERDALALKPRFDVRVGRGFGTRIRSGSSARRSTAG